MAATGYQDNVGNILGTNSASNLYNSDTVTANVDGSIIERLEAMKNGEAAGQVYYVEANDGNDTTGDGSSWNKAFKTLTVAFVASNANIASGSTGWASRNKIYYKGDNAEGSMEELITLPSKCDVIGVGSYDHRPQPSLIGNHVIGAGAYMGTRFINMGFQSPAAGGVIFTAPTTTSGLNFLGCVFDGRSATAATIAIQLTAVEQAVISGCNFFGKYSTATINIGAGAGRAMRITDNVIESGAIGVAINSNYTCVDSIGIISGNEFAVVTLVIDDNSSKIAINSNIGQTESDGKIATTFDYLADLACNNLITNLTTHTTSIYPAQGAIPA